MIDIRYQVTTAVVDDAVEMLSLRNGGAAAKV